MFFYLFQQQSQIPPFQNEVIVQKYWFVSEQVDKTLLTKIAQEFCGHFPVYRLQEVSLNFTNGGRTRLGK